MIGIRQPNLRKNERAGRKVKFEAHLVIVGQIRTYIQIP